MSEALPPTILACVTQLAQECMAWIHAHRDAPLAEQEAAVLAAVRRAQSRLLAAVLPLCTRALTFPEAGRRQPCPDCGVRLGSHQWRTRRVRTVCGPVAFERPYYYCRPCRRGWAPADASLGLVPFQRISPGLQAWLVAEGVSHDFREAAERLEDRTGLAVAPETIRQHSIRVGAAWEAAQQDAIAEVAATQEAAEPVEAAPGHLVVEADGLMLRYRDGWHEVKLGAVGGHVDDQTGALSYVAARESAEQFGPRLLTEAARRGALDIIGWSGPVTGKGLAQLRPVVVLGDGAPWIWNLAAEHFGERTEIVDFYHASEHLWAVANGVYGQGSAEAKVWAEARLDELGEDGAAPVLAALQQLRPTTAEASELVRRERGYFRTNQARMAYPTFRAQGFPIGSGAVESATKHVVQLRMKRPGMRWSPHGAQALLAVCARRSSGRSLLPHTKAA